MMTVFIIVSIALFIYVTGYSIQEYQVEEKKRNQFRRVYVSEPQNNQKDMRSLESAVHKKSLFHDIPVRNKPIHHIPFEVARTRRDKDAA